MVDLWPGSSWEIDSSINPHEAKLLKLDITKAKSKLNWNPTWDIDITLEKIVKWHISWINKIICRITA